MHVLTHVIQSVLFDRGKFTEIKARVWLKDHGLIFLGKSDITPHEIRFRQINPAIVRQHGFTRFITKRLGESGIQYIIAYK